jgi:hypothetical protein
MTRKNFYSFSLWLRCFQPAILGSGSHKEKVVAGAERGFEKFTKAYVAPGLVVPPRCHSTERLYSKRRSASRDGAQHSNTPQTIFESGSVAKQFTAAAIVLLQQDGKLSLDDPVRKYIPELPDYGSPLIIRHLLNHTSGIRDWGTVMSLTGAGRGDSSYQPGSRT